MMIIKMMIIKMIMTTMRMKTNLKICLIIKKNHPESAGKTIRPINTKRKTIVVPVKTSMIWIWTTILPKMKRKSS